MIEETPPSSESVRAEPISAESVRAESVRAEPISADSVSAESNWTEPISEPRGWDQLNALRVTKQWWDATGVPDPGRAFLVGIGAWALLAWNRFGIQGIAAPRSVARFLLVGIYGWIGLSVLIWLVALFAERVRPSPNRRVAGRGLFLTIGLAHQPLVMFGLLLQLSQLIPLSAVMPVATAAVLLLWFPAVLVAATNSVTNQGWRRSAAFVLPSYVVWLLLVGTFVVRQLGHLV